MHPRLLKTFLAVARNRNFTRAAEEVHLAQSSVSDQIQSLEAELGTALFIRSRSGLELTAAGEALRPYAEEILTIASEARTAVEAVSAHCDNPRLPHRAPDVRSLRPRAMHADKAQPTQQVQRVG